MSNWIILTPYVPATWTDNVCRREKQTRGERVSGGMTNFLLLSMSVTDSVCSSGWDLTQNITPNLTKSPNGVQTLPKKRMKWMPRY